MARDWHTAGSSEITVIGIDRPTLDKDIQKIVGQFDWVVIDEDPLALYFYMKERIVFGSVHLSIRVKLMVKVILSRGRGGKKI